MRTSDGVARAAVPADAAAWALAHGLVEDDGARPAKRGAWASSSASTSTRYARCGG